MNIYLIALISIDYAVLGLAVLAVWICVLAGAWVVIRLATAFADVCYRLLQTPTPQPPPAVTVCARCAAWQYPPEIDPTCEIDPNSLAQIPWRVA
ncbi:hypothetical protein [Frankia sp. Cr1]|uniref:hypothetical protein n=1 Tax=Frankia sp. Cr1 TaxID=3073931 RepID=UPI002AD374DE|nr:hypothetical protein [Frankia sp. Cr1]